MPVQVAIPSNAVSTQALVPFALQPGQVLSALVLQLLEEGQVRLAIANTVLDVVSQVPLQPGTNVRLMVQGTSPVLTLAVVDTNNAPAARGTVAAATAARTQASGAVGEAQAAPTVSADPSMAQPARTAAPPSPAVALARAVRSAALRQGGLAPLFADVTAVKEAAVLPAPVREAMTQLLALRSPTAGPVTAAQVEQALSRSGLFLEARVAGTVAAAPALDEGDPASGASGAQAHAVAAANVKPGAMTPGEPLAVDLKAALVVLRQVLNTWLGTMPAKPDVASPPLQPGSPSTDPAPPSPGEPTIVASPKPGADGGTGAAPTDQTAAADARAVRAAVMAAQDSATQAARGGPMQADGADDRTPAPLGAPAAAARLATIVRPDRSLVELLAPQQAEPGRVPPPVPREPDAATVPQPEGRDGGQPMTRPAAPPPPYGGAPTTAQPPVKAALTADAGPRVIGERLLTETDAALARHTLLQAASLPGDGAQNARDSVRWVFEVPFAMSQGTAVAQFEIARDGRGGSAREAQPAWRARFTLDVEPIGPVHAQIALSGTRASVTLWAEREASAARLRDDAGLLAQALMQAELEPGDVLVRDGEPPRPPEPAGRFLDRAS